MINHTLPKLLEVKEVASILGFSEKGIYGLVAQRKIPHIKISNRLRFDREDVLEWLRKNRVPSSER